MINIEYYLTDGANWQAQCVLAYLRYMGNLKVQDLTWNEEKERYEGELRVGRCENCREQGYVFTIIYGVKELVHFWVYEHRNSDDLCVVEFEGFFINTPTINDIPMRDKYDYYMAHFDEVEKMLQKGEERARVIARETIDRVKKAVGVI